MTPAEKAIAEILLKYDEDLKDNTWVVPGGKARAIYHKTIERIVAKAGIWFDPPQIVSAAPDNVVIIVTGHLGDNLTDWSFGEASPKNNKNAYPFAMAEKRGKDRVALKLIGLHGHVYSEEEADDFKRPAAREAAPSSDPDGFVDEFVNGEPAPRRSAYGAKKDGLWLKIEQSLLAKTDWLGLAIFTGEDWGALPAAWPAQIVEAWGKCVEELLARECQSPAEVKHWMIENDATIKQLPIAYTNELRHVCSRALANLRKLEAVG